jgi:DNA-binding NtrC family response regulator
VVLLDGQTIEVWNLPAKLREGFNEARAGRSYEEELRDFKRRLVVQALQKSNGNKVEAARSLGVARGYLHRLIRDLQVQPEATTPAPNHNEAKAPNLVM